MDSHCNYVCVQYPATWKVLGSTNWSPRPNGARKQGHATWYWYSPFSWGLYIQHHVLNSMKCGMIMIVKFSTEAKTTILNRPTTWCRRVSHGSAPHPSSPETKLSSDFSKIQISISILLQYRFSFSIALSTPSWVASGRGTLKGGDLQGNLKLTYLDMPGVPSWHLLGVWIACRWSQSKVVHPSLIGPPFDSLKDLKC